MSPTLRNHDALHLEEAGNEINEQPREDEVGPDGSDNKGRADCPANEQLVHAHSDIEERDESETDTASRDG